MVSNSKSHSISLSSSTITTTILTTATTISVLALLWLQQQKRKNNNHKNYITYEECIGKTPLIHLKKLSSKIGHGKQIYVKMESFNPGGTGKDRAALYMLRDAEARGDLPPPILQHPMDEDSESSEDDLGGDMNDMSNTTKNTTNDHLSNTIDIAISKSKTGGIVVEGTSGSTGISLATLSAQRGHSVIIVMPDDQAQEKQTILKCLGAVVHVVPTAAISNPNHYVNVAKKIAQEINQRCKRTGSHLVGESGMSGNGFIKAAFMNQFENKANYNAHLSTTGPEVYEQTNGNIDAFCMSAGTGGTISGVGQYLKLNCRHQKHKRNDRDENCKIILIDPPGSALYNKIKYNIAYTSEQRERGLLRHRYDTIAEGIGLDRITDNFALGLDQNVIDDAIRISDQDAVDVAHWLLKEEGLFVGSSSAMNVAGAIRFAMSSANKNSVGANSPSCIVTVVCDGGQRHLTRFWNREFITGWKLLWPSDDENAWKRRLDVIFSVNVSK